MLEVLFVLACLSDQPGTCQPKEMGPPEAHEECTVRKAAVLALAESQGVQIRMATCYPVLTQEARNG